MPHGLQCCVRHPALLVGIVGALALACQRQPTRQYPLKGQLITVGPPRQDARVEVAVAHEDIPNFMPAMTMAYFVNDRKLLEGMAPGDVITATLVVRGNDLHLENIRKTGHAALPPAATTPRVMEVMAPGDDVPGDVLRDQDGVARRLTDWRGRALAVTFVYTRCPLPDFCPLMDRQFGSLQKAIKADARLRDTAHLVSISFDPGHDTPAVIAAHARARGADPAVWSYLTGTPEAIDRLTSRFGVSAIAEKGDVPSIAHNLRTAIVDPKGRLVKIYSGNDWTVDALLNDLRQAGGR